MVPHYSRSMELEVLKDLGLTENEARVYLFLLEKGVSTATEMTAHLSIHRVNLYDLLKRLTEKGLVSSTQEGKSKKYSATDPEYLLKGLEEKEALLKKILPDLELKKNSSRTKQETKVFQGEKGIKAILEDTLKQKNKIYIFGAQGNFAHSLPTYFDHYNKKRKDAKIEIKIIHSEKMREWRRRNSLPFSKVRFISDVYDSPATTFIYGNKVAIIMWTNPLLGIVVDSSELTKSYLNFFTVLWKIAKK